MNTISSVVVNFANGNSKIIEVNDDGTIMIYGRTIKYKVVDECSANELINAKGEIIEAPTPVAFDEKLKKINDELKTSKPYNDFESAVQFLTELNADEFLELVKAVENNGNNKFPKFVSKLRNVVNADDAYCSALISLSRPKGNDIEAFAFTLMNKCLANVDGAFEQFAWLWKKLKED